MSSKPDLRLDWCSHAAAKYAVEHWHYSGTMPAGKTVKIGVWEEGVFIGVVIFARGSNKHLGKPFGLSQTQCVELVRVAIKDHETPTSRILAISCRMLKGQSAGIRLLLSFADMGQGHIGTLYQAAGWTYTGTGTSDERSRPYRAPDRSVHHWRSVAGALSARGMASTIKAAISLGYVPMEKKLKHRYLMPLDPEMRKQIDPLAKPYPKRAGSIGSDAPGFQPGEGGADPTPALEGNHNA